MKVLELATNKELDVNEAYGARMIEQGKATVILPKKKAEAENEAPADKTGKKK